jgi:hypothetical protein
MVAEKHVISSFAIPFYYGTVLVTGSAKAKSYGSGSATLVANSCVAAGEEGM